ncbi:unnamed protein product [Effrenium voratum]|nr:unnamed protein product [Effrenium voratum]
MHSQLLLCEPCVTDLAAHIAGGLAVREASDVGQQLAFGLGHLHSHGILYGGFDAAGVLRGGDGLWKLGSFGRCALLPVAASEWLERREGEMSTPPEARSSTDDALKPEADVWLLGAFLGFLLSARPSGDALALPPQRLADAQVARLWLLLHWLLAEAPEARPCAGEAAALLGALQLTPPQELLAEMPAPAAQRAGRMAIAAARQAAAERAKDAEAVAELAPERLRGLSPEIDRILENCGLDAAFVLDASGTSADASAANAVPAPPAPAAAKATLAGGEVDGFADASTASGASEDPDCLRVADSADLLGLG